MARSAHYSGNDLRERVTIQDCIVTTNAAREKVETWTDEVTGIAAMVRYERGSEKLRAGRLDQSVPALVVVRYRPEVKPEKRLTHEGRVLRIHSVIDPDGRKRWLEIVCGVDG